MKKKYSKLLVVITAIMYAALSGCASVNSFPTIARPGDTVSLMIGGSENARKNNVSAVFTDASGQAWDLQALGLVRSVFNLRTDGRAQGLHYSSNTEKSWSWSYGHEPIQTVLVTDMPQGVAPGMGYLMVSFININDNSSGAGNNVKLKLEIIAGAGTSNQFSYINPIYGTLPADFTRLESAPYAKVQFSNSKLLIGAASLVISFDNTVLNPNDINIYSPESTVKVGSPVATFGKTQRMLFWHQDGSKLYVDILAPQGISSPYLQFFVIHPQGLTGTPALNILSAQIYDISGNAIAVTPSLTYHP